jgi:hypothetical protein
MAHLLKFAPASSVTSFHIGDKITCGDGYVHTITGKTNYDHIVSYQTEYEMVSGGKKIKMTAIVPHNLAKAARRSSRRNRRRSSTRNRKQNRR